MSLGYYFLLPVLFSFLIPFFKKLGKSGVGYSSVLLNLILFGGAFSYTFASIPKIAEFSIAPPMGIAFVLDRLSLLFLLIFTFSSLMVSIYLITYFKEQTNENESRFYLFFNMLLAGVSGLILSCDIFNVYIFFEITGISSYALSAFKKDKKALEAGIKYLIIGSIASIFIVFSIMLIYLQLGTLNIGLISQRIGDIDPQMSAFIALMLFIGFGTKAELFPLNFWVPDIYQGSNSCVAGLFSSIVSKAYLFVFFHLFYLLGFSKNYAVLIMILGGVTFLVSEFTALNQKDIKRLFAYSTLGQLGLLFFALSSNSNDIISGALFHLSMHSIAKLALFLSLGLIIGKLNDTDIKILGNFKSIFLSVVLLVSFLSLLGIPPFGGFIGKILILKGFALSQNYFAVGFILFVSLIEAVYFFRLISLMLNKTTNRVEIKVGVLNYAVLGVLLFLIVLFGLYPSMLLHFTDMASTALLYPNNYLNFALGVGL